MSILLNSASCSAVIGPRRRMSIFLPCTAMMVDSIPCGVGPASTISGMRPPSSSKTCRAVVELIRPNRFALGAASGFPNTEMISAKTGCELIRTATVSRPAVTMSGTIDCRSRTSVSGPGQNCAISSLICAREASSIFATRVSHSSPGKCTISGSKRGRSFVSKIFVTATGSSASAASPYTVSVGSATTSPLRSSSTAAVTARDSSPLRSVECRYHERRSLIAATISVFTLATLPPARFRFVSYEMLPIFSASLRQK